ncbi:MAG: alpha-amylase family glycosyl hydrolase [Fimbriimonas sp.]
MILAALLAPQADVVAYTFTLRLDQPASQVHLAGTFNNWDKRATKMQVGADGRTYTTTVRLLPGKHQYKFVLNDDTWITDPRGTSEPDGNGNTNSILIVLPKDYVGAASSNDGRIAASALQHSTETPFFNYDRGRLTVSLRARPNDLQAVHLVLDGKRRVPARFERIDDLYGRYIVSVPWDRKADLAYAFEVRDGAIARTFGPKGLGGRGEAGEFRVPKTYQPFEVPAWVERSVLYQIFPDRFENGDRTNDPKDVVAWDGKPEYFNRFGGDVAGVRKRLGHFADLGIDCVYFNPIFKAPSNHRYDATDYLTVDPTFGTNDDFARLTRELKAKGIRTVLDGVYNHTATDFFAFADVRQKGKASEYADWYTFHSFPVQVKENPNYVAWFNFPSMPKLNLSNPETRRYMLDIPRFWDRKAEIAGWRLDVANEVQMDFWRDFRKVVKGIDRDNWIVGEVWGDGSPWLKGDQWDSVMNYRFRNAVLGFVGKDGSGKPSQFLNELMSVYNGYAPQVSRNMMNLLGSHDTPRILTLCGGDRDLAKLAAVVQFTWVGAPSIYYGDELGMEGDKDPDNRRGMRWDLANPQNDFLSLYRRLVKIRQSHRALQSGDPLPLATDDAQGTATYARVLGSDYAVVAVNRSGEPRDVAVSLAGLPGRRTSFLDALTDRPLKAAKGGNVIVSLPPKGAAVLIPR